MSLKPRKLNTLTLQGFIPTPKYRSSSLPHLSPWTQVTRSQLYYLFIIVLNILHEFSFIPYTAHEVIYYKEN